MRRRTRIDATAYWSDVYLIAERSATKIHTLIRQLGLMLLINKEAGLVSIHDNNIPKYRAEAPPIDALVS